MTFKSTLIAGLIGIALAAPALAEPYVLDKSHAHVAFSVNHLGFSTVQGQFRKFDAEIDFDPKAIEATKLRFVIDAASIDTGWEKRDAHIVSPDFLDAATHKEIVFQATKVVATGADTADITGDLTLKGVTKPVTFKAKLNKMGPSPFNPAQTIAGFEVTGEIDRTAFGVSFAAPAVGVVIPVRIDLEMSPKG